ncbi:hypothetical protein BCV70DRAFT_198408 [Testicularia cyperi]|uniref:Uncharacterized protein n=1 Tax=Testicularia cyperi TaxID=1882483 RepID=A0A317XW39_9BASI|nr:hypothetical protein BCV70DRAFT_198408 [Testicularia cyperi]
MARVYSLWIFDRHCNPIYHQDWSHLHTPAGGSLGGGGHTSPTASQSSGFASLGATIQRATGTTPATTPDGRALPPQRPGQPSLPNVTRQGGASTSPSASASASASAGNAQMSDDQRSSTGSNLAFSAANSVSQSVQPSADLLPFDEEAKLVYGVVFSLRNMVRKLGGDSESFNSFTTSTYTLAHLHTPTMYTFVILTDPVPPPSTIPSRASDGYSISGSSAALSGRSGFGTGGGIPGTGGMSLKGVLLQIYRGPWVDNVVKNPLTRALEREERAIEPTPYVDNTSHAPRFQVTKETKLDRLQGIDTDAFREAIEKVLAQNKLAAPSS